MTPAVVEASIAELRAMLDSGQTSSVALVHAYLDRIGAYDRHGLHLNAVPVLNPDMFADAKAADARRRAGEVRGPLDGIPYTAKDSYAVRGLTVAAGSPAFERLVAQDDAFTIARLREAGAVLIGLTNMPPMANGGMQRGVYGRAESPYDERFLTSAFGSGSSNGSGTATGASFAAFGLGEETWSSGRAPASCNALCAYTPSRGVISMRGNWPLVPTMDVVVPHARSMADLLAVLDVLVADDDRSRGDFWRVQPWVSLPRASEVRPQSYAALGERRSLTGVRLGVPKMYIGNDDAPDPVITDEAVLELWRAAREKLEALGAEVIEVDFPVVRNYEGDRRGADGLATRGFVPREFPHHEIWDLSVWAWNDYLAANGDPQLHALAEADGARIFPQPEGALADRYGHLDLDPADYVEFARAGVPELESIPSIPEGLAGLERTRQVDLEDWMRELGLDAVVFPAVGGVGPADSDTNPASAALTWRNGTWVANGNLVPRHLGIPTVTVPMGEMAGTSMPVGLTVAGGAYSDSLLLEIGAAFEASATRRRAPERTPELETLPDASARTSGVASLPPAVGPGPEALRIDARVRGGADGEPGEWLEIHLRVGAELAGPPRLSWNGETLPLTLEDGGYFARVAVPEGLHRHSHSQWRGSYGSVLVASATLADDAPVGTFAVAGGIA